MNQITKDLLGIIADWKGSWDGSYYIRENGVCAGTHTTKNVTMTPMKDRSGLTIRIEPGSTETVYIPACVTKGNIDDIVYNDFFIGANAYVKIVAGCGVHTDTHETARHNGHHRFFLEEGARVMYEEKHVGSGDPMGKKQIDPVTDIHLAKNSYLQMDTVQIGGVDMTTRTTSAVLDENAQLVIHESIMTEGEQRATTEFCVDMNGEDSSVNLISRSVAKDRSYQDYHSRINGKVRCTGHSECDAILMGDGRVNAAPELFAGNIDASLIHEAAIGKIAGEQIIKLRTLGLTEEEAEEKIIEGFLMGSVQ